MGKKTYAQLPNGKILNWIDVLNKYNLYHSEGISAHVEFDDYALTKKKLQDIVVVIKNEDGDFVNAVKNKNGVWVESGNEDNGEEVEDNEKYCDVCGEFLEDCECERCKKCNRLVNLCDCITIVDSNDSISENKGRISILSEPNNTKCYFVNEDVNCHIEGDEYSACGSFDVIPGRWSITFYKSKYDECTKEIQVNKYQVRNVSIKLEKTNLSKLQKSSSQVLDFENVKSTKESLEKEKIEKQKLEYERTKKERIEKEKVEQEKLDKLREENRLRLLQEEKLNNEKIEKQRFDQKQEQERFVKEQKDNVVKSEEIQNDNENDDYIISNGKKIITRAQLPNGEVISWRKLLERYNLPHRKGYSAHYEWDEYFKYRKGLPEVKVVSSNGSYVDTDKKERIHFSIAERSAIWETYFPNKTKGICPCCKVREVYIISFDLGHNEPFSKGGIDDLENLVPICSVCNQGMKNKYTIVEYKARLGSIKKLV